MIVRPLHEDDERRAFESGKDETDRFVHHHALVNHRAGSSRVYVAVEDASSHEVLGFYALSATSVESSAVRDLASVSLPGYPMPALLIGQLAVDRCAQRRKVGTRLLRHALANCIRLSEHVAVFGVLVDALNEEVTSFYRRFGFEPIPPEKSPQPMFLPQATLKEAASRR